jgi:hypothetical protein
MTLTAVHLLRNIRAIVFAVCRLPISEIARSDLTLQVRCQVFDSYENIFIALLIF